MTKEEADYLEQLVAFPSVTADKKASLACARFCAEFFQGKGLRTRLIESAGFPNVVAFSQDTKTPKVLLQCHMDVVPAEEPMFKMRRDGGRFTGRGVFDMKFACASYMKLLDDLGDDITKYDFGIMLTFDEEIGGHDGVEALLKQGYGADVCILPDSGKDWRLEATGNGAWFVRLDREGRNAHGSLPGNGINAAEILTEALGELYGLRKEYEPEDLTLSLTKLDSGEAMNQIPDHAEAVLDIRFRTDDIYEDLKARMEAICRRHGVRISDIELFACVNVDTDEPCIADFLEVAEEVLGRKITTSHSTGSTDARYLCAKDIPTIVIQPDGGDRHGDDEWVDAEGVRQLTKILRKYLDKRAVL